MIEWMGKAARSIAWPCRKAGKGIAWLWSKLSLLKLFLVAAIAAAVGAYFRQRVAFPQAGSSGEPISATVYVKTLPAQVDLKSTFTPSATTNNVSFTVTVTGPTKRPDPWLLVVRSAAPSSNPYPRADLWSEGPADKQFIGQVLVVPGPTKKPLNFTCATGLSQYGQSAAKVVQDRDLNLSLPVLEQNPDGQPMLAGAPLYAEKVAGKYKNLVAVQALPGAPLPGPCPVSTSRTAYPDPAGTVTRRTLPAIAVTLGGFIGLRLVISVFVRQHYMAAVTTYYNVADSFTPRGQAWVLAQGAISPTGRVVPTGWGDLYPALPASCQKLLPGSPTAKGDSLNAVFSCMQAHGWRGFATYQPASRYWPCQGIETGIYVLLAAALIAVTYVIIRRRDA